MHRNPLLYLELEQASWHCTPLSHYFIGARVPWEDGARLNTQGLPLFEQSPPFKIKDTTNVGLIRVQGGQTLKTVICLLIPPMCKCAYTVHVHPSICPCLLEYSDNITNAEKSVMMCWTREIALRVVALNVQLNVIVENEYQECNLGPSLKR